ncbi:glycosyltransferase [Burkholderia vietnamiensis]|uniref:glycosyltransferase n=1 Tax=Burkholderia vietnamiensis TaxID=60552 RepID=UPI0007577C55|nr:glycosyltransferase [Burkholderia vietnamiensis]KVR88527.1 glycosyl transferase [Burkholderia vietnamiensis]KVS32318.1 glycosyl transferase [Burkholderia vietnamiensis]MBR8002141.1 glycosyltransferase [Burkholderia vietnamiensis]MCA7945976.1 glycosyltransferase [Burkholderia vietnamiensis]HDR8973932.1 glycosyltransferase [Burkholderia vietnamiensis]
MSQLKVFVTSELFPFTAGGIGRVIANLLDLPAFSRAGGRPGASEVAVVFLGESIDRRRFEARFPGVLLVDATPETYVEYDHHTGFRYARPDLYTTHPLHAVSVRAMQALKCLEREHGALDYVEFPDWGAIAFASLQEKRLGLAFQETTIAIRLHTSDSVLNAMEARFVDQSSLSLYDLERKALADCDLIIGQVPGSAKAMQRVFDFDDPEWLPRLVIDAPPVVLDYGAPAHSSIVATAHTPIVFSSKIQRIKRPDVFVRGCCDFLRLNPHYCGPIRLMAMATEADYLAEVRALIPPALLARFHFAVDADSEARHRAISESVCIFPGTFESFCLAAYEASLSGAICVLTDANPAFGDESPWCDGVNCWKFDGAAADLSRVLSAIFASPHAVQTVSVPVGERPWTLPKRRPAAKPGAGKSGDALVSVLIPHFNLGSYIEETVDSVLGSDYPHLEVIIVDDASTDQQSREVLRRLEGRNDTRLNIVWTEQNSGLAATRNTALSHARGAYTLTLDADDLIERRFVSIAVRALSRDPDISFVVPQTAYFDDQPGADPEHDAWSQCITFVGEARSSGLRQNRFSTATMMSRTDVLRGLRYDESLSAYEDWDLYLRAVMARKRFVVTNAVQFYYRRRSGSMIHSDAAARRIGLYYHDIVRRKHIAFGGMGLPMYVLEGLGGVAHGESVEMLRAKLAAYEGSVFVAAALALRARLDRMPGWLRMGLKHLAGCVWRLRNSMRKRAADGSANK